MALRNQLDSQV